MTTYTKRVENVKHLEVGDTVLEREYHSGNVYNGHDVEHHPAWYTYTVERTLKSFPIGTIVVTATAKMRLVKLREGDGGWLLLGRPTGRDVRINDSTIMGDFADGLISVEYRPDGEA